MSENISMKETKKLLGGFVYGRVGYLQTLYLQGDSKARAELANLRKSVGKQLGDTPESWAVVLGGLPEELEGYGDLPTPAERAVYAALTFYALHQQSKATPMHVARKSEADVHQTGFGDAVRKLAAARGVDGPNKGITTRFLFLTSVEDFSEFLYHMRGLIAMLRAKSIPLDYGLLAVDMFLLQIPSAASSVRLRWGREFYRAENGNKKNDR